MAASDVPSIASEHIHTTFDDTFTESTISQEMEPLMKRLTKDKKGKGDSFTFLNVFGDVACESPDFDEAQDVAKTAKEDGAKGVMQWAWSYGVARVSNKQILQGQDGGGWLKTLEHKTISNLRHLTYRWGIHLFRQGWGELGKANTSGAASATMQFTDKSAIYGVFKGQRHVFSASINANLLRVGGALTVLSVDYGTNTITYTANTNTITNLTAGDYIFQSKSREDSATPTRLCPVGLPALIPNVAPATGDSLHGVDRSVAPTQLAGHRVNATGISKTDALIRAVSLVANVGHGKNLVAICSIENMEDLSIQLESYKIQDLNKPGTANIGQDSIRLKFDGVTCELFSSFACLSSEIYVGDPDALELKSIGIVPRVDDLDGNSALRMQSVNGIEVRTHATGNYRAVDACKWAVIFNLPVTVT